MLPDDLDGAAVDALGAPDDLGVPGSRVAHASSVVTSPSTPCRYAAELAQLDGAVRVCLGKHGDEADALVEGALEVGLRHAAEVLDRPEDRRRRPGRAVDARERAGRQHPGQVGGEPATGDVAQGVDLDASVGE